MATTKEISIEEGNKIIAEFMGLSTEKIWADCIVFSQHGKEIGGYVEPSFSYHSSWDWQVPAWSKISHITQNLASKSEENAEKHLKLCDRYEQAIFQNKPGLGQEVIVEAILWYNSLLNKGEG